MSLVESLLGAIVRLDGDALVMHVGEKPYVVTTSEATNAYRGPVCWGQVELSSRTLTLDAVAGMVGEFLPPDERRQLADVGAIEYELPPSPVVPGRFVVIAARGGDDVWLEIRLRRPEPAVGTSVALEEEPAAAPSREETPEIPEPVEPEPYPAPVEVVGADHFVIEDDQQYVPGEPPLDLDADEVAHEVEMELDLEPHARQPRGNAGATPPASSGTAETDGIYDLSDLTGESLAEATLDVLIPPGNARVEDAGLVGVEPPEAEREPGAMATSPVPEEASEQEPAPAVGPAPVEEAGEVLLEAGPETSLEIEPQAEAAPAPLPEPRIEAEEQAAARAEEIAEAPPGSPPEPFAAFDLEPHPEPLPELVAEVALERPVEEPERQPMREDVPVEVEEAERGAMAEAVAPASTFTRTEPVTEAPEEEVVESRSIEGSTLDRLLWSAAARGASAMYLVTGLAPVVRVDGAIAPLEGADVPSADDVRSMLLELAPDSVRGALETGAGAEWASDVAGIGRVRCLSFSDHRGPGGIFRMLTAQALTVEQLGLSRELQSLCAESEGLVLVAGLRLSGRSTLLTGLVGLVNRSRADHVITIESQIQFVHGSHRAFVSQREVRGGTEQQAAAVRAALREDPDVLAIDDVRSPETMALALEAAQSGRLVLCTVTAPSATAAIEQVVSQFPPDRRDQVYAALAGALRGVVAQVLLRRMGGGKVTARELLLNTRAIASVLLERRLVELAPALDQGRPLGMAPLNDALVSLVRSGAVAPGDAFRKASDQDGFLAELRRQGLDTSFVERLT